MTSLIPSPWGLVIAAGAGLLSYRFSDRLLDGIFGKGNSKVRLIIDNQPLGFIDKKGMRSRVFLRVYNVGDNTAEKCIPEVDFGADVLQADLSWYQIVPVLPEPEYISKIDGTTFIRPRHQVLILLAEWDTCASPNFPFVRASRGSTGWMHDLTVGKEYKAKVMVVWGKKSEHRMSRVFKVRFEAWDKFVCEPYVRRDLRSIYLGLRVNGWERLVRRARIPKGVKLN